MSRINPRQTHPAKFFAQWGGSEGVLSYYDKETKEDVELPLPFTFLVLDELNTVKGWSDADHSGIWSNEVYDITNDVLRVKTKRGLVAKGTWNDVKNQVTGARYVKSVYIAYKDETGELQLANIQFVGAALNAWIEFNKTYDVYKGAVTLTGKSDEKKKGKTIYFEPLFEGKNVSKETDEAAKEINRQLDSYLKTYLSREDDNEEVVAEDYPDDEPGDTASDEAPKTSPKPAAEKAPEIEETDNKIDLSEVPF